MSTTYFETPVDKKAQSNPLGLKGVDHIEFIVDNADQWRDFFTDKYGMTVRAYGDAASGLQGRRAFVVGQGRVSVQLSAADGDVVAPGDVLLAATGPVADLLTAERTALNLLTHLSGVATATRL